MKIAVCISGYSKELTPHAETWIELFNSLNCEVNYFAHMWDNNADVTNSVLKIKPHKFIIEPDAKRKQVSVILPEDDTLYSFMRSANLKRQDEINNHYFYDVCFNVNLNVKFHEETVEQFRDIFVKPKNNFIYTFNSEHVEYFPFFTLRNDFFFSNSLTFDKLAQFNRFLPVIKNAVPVPALWGYYIKMLNIRNKNNILPYEKF